MITNGRLNRVLNSSTKMLMKMPRIHDLVLRLHSKDPGENLMEHEKILTLDLLNAVFSRAHWCSCFPLVACGRRFGLIFVYFVLSHENAEEVRR